MQFAEVVLEAPLATRAASVVNHIQYEMRQVGSRGGARDRC